MSQFNVGSLADVTAYNSFAGRAILTSTQLNNAYGDIQTAINNLNDAAQAIASCQSGASAPGTNRQGEIWYDTTNTQWKGDPDGAGHDDNFATRLQTYLIDFAMASTETYRIGGCILIDVATYTKAGDTGVLGTYTLPAGTLALVNT